MSITETNELISRDDAGELLGVSPRTLGRWARLGKGPPRTKVGRSIFYRRSSLEQWLLSQEESPTS